MSNTKPKKYIFVNGVMQKNPAFEAYMHPNEHKPVHYKHHNDELAVISNGNDLLEAQALQQTLTDIDIVEIQYVPSTTAAMDQFHSSSHQQQFMPSVSDAVIVCTNVCVYVCVCAFFIEYLIALVNESVVMSK